MIGWQDLSGATPTMISVAPLRGTFPTSTTENLSPAWTPDGKSIVFHATANREKGMYEGTEFALYLVPATGGTSKRLTPAGTSYTSPTFSPAACALRPPRTAPG